MRLLFEHGEFTANDTVQTAWAVALFALGLYAYSGVKVTAPAFYALDKTKVPMAASVTAVATNVAISVAFFDQYGFRVLAIGMTAAAVVNFVVLFVNL